MLRRSAASGCLVGHLPEPLLAVIMAEGAPLAPCTCTIAVSLPPEGVAVQW